MTVKATLRFSYDEPSGIDWVQEKGDVKSLEGYWRFEALGADKTRATYGLVVDPGRMLGMLLRGPAEAKALVTPGSPARSSSRHSTRRRCGWRGSREPSSPSWTATS